MYRNLFLKVLPPRDLALLRPSLQFVELKQGDLLGEPGQQVSDVLFIEGGMVLAASRPCRTARRSRSPRSAANLFSAC
jgi:hypothetical protein